MPLTRSLPGAFAVFLLALVTADRLPVAVPIAYAVMSLITFAVYALDKRAAQQGAWRTPENTLHTLALLGGWPGAMLAQEFLRHKSQKASFRQVFWITVLLNGAVLAGLVMGG
jgi:uncharacterized membrane protein YsdA (DUF1294 family)